MVKLEIHDLRMADSGKRRQLYEAINELLPERHLNSSATPCFPTISFFIDSPTRVQLWGPLDEVARYEKWLRHLSEAPYFYPIKGSEDD